MFRWIRCIGQARRPVERITLYRDENCKLSEHFLSRLSKFGQMPKRQVIDKDTEALSGDTRLKFEIEMQTQLPCYNTYKFLHQECIPVHPQNLKSFERAFPFLFEKKDITSLNSRLSSMRGMKKFIGDVQLLEREEYDLLAKHPEFFKGPLIVDWTNNLVATDDEGLDKIITNYVACGMQDFHKDKIDISNLDKEEEKIHFRESMKRAGHVPHPHVAEFADLF